MSLPHITKRKREYKKSYHLAPLYEQAETSWMIEVRINIGSRIFAFMKWGPEGDILSSDTISLENHDVNAIPTKIWSSKENATNDSADSLVARSIKLYYAPLQPTAPIPANNLGLSNRKCSNSGKSIGNWRVSDTNTIVKCLYFLKTDQLKPRERLWLCGFIRPKSSIPFSCTLTNTISHIIWAP